MPNAGYEVAGATPRAINAVARGSPFTMTEDGTLDTGSAYIEDAATGDTFVMVLYNATTPSSAPIVATSATRTNISTVGWYTFTFSGEALVDGVTYVPIVGSNSAASANVYHDAGTGYALVSFNPNSPPNPADLDAGGDARLYSTYITYSTGGAPAPSITDVDEDNTVTLEQANVEIDGADFDTATVEIRQGGFTYLPSIDSQNATTIVFDMAAVGTTGPDSAPHPGAATVAVVNGDDQEDTQAVTITDRAGSDSVLVGTPNADPDLRLDATADVEAGDYVMWFNVQGGDETDVVVNDDLTFDCDEAVTAFDFQVWDQDDGTWGDAATQTIAAGPFTTGAGRKRDGRRRGFISHLLGRG